MVLNSQSPRSDSPGKGRHHAAYYRRPSRRRGKRGLLVVLLLAVVVYAVIHFVWGPGAGQPAENTGNTTHNTATDDNGHDTPATPTDDEPAKPVTQPIDRPVGRGAPVTDKPKPPPKVDEPPKQPAPNTALPAGDSQVAQALTAAEQLAAAGKLVKARDELNRIHVARRASPSDAARVRAAMAKINQTLVFSSAVVEGDPHATGYVVRDGDLLSAIAPSYNIPWQLVQRINNVDPGRVRIGQTLKLIRGPFHIVVDKSDFRLDAYLGDPTKPGSMYVRSFDVGLGTGDSTPVGRFIVKRGGKAEDPPWINPRNRSERYTSDDPKNPIGDRWIGLRGTDANTQSLEGYGIHGTIEPQSIGKQASMGCVRVRDEDVKLVYDLVSEEKTTVTIQE